MKSPRGIAFTLFAAAFVCLQFPSAYAGIADPNLHWNYASPLIVNETITQLSASSYRYSYSFTNIDTSSIWHFGVYTNFVTTDGTEFAGRSDWEPVIFKLTPFVYAEYAPKKEGPYAINADIIGVTLAANVKELPLDGTTAIQPGDKVSGFSFVASTLDMSAKYYFYETMASGWTQDRTSNPTGAVAAVGQTIYIPEPATLALLCGGLATLRIRRKK